MPGVWTWNFGEAFAPLYLDSVAMNHNAIGRGYETFGNGTAETLEWTLVRVKARASGNECRPRPPTPFLWSARDNVNYKRDGGARASTRRGAAEGMLLRNFHRKGLELLAEGRRRGKPYAFAIPADQGDRQRVAAAGRPAAAQHIEVRTARAPRSTVKEGDFPAGHLPSCGLDQPYRNYAVDLLTPQDFPRTAASPTTTSRGSCPRTIGVQAVATADARGAGAAARDGTAAASR